MNFRREILGEWPQESEREKQAIELLADYYRRTEAFDRTIPGAPSPRNPHTWLPRPEYSAPSQRFASRELSRVLEKLQHCGFSSREIDQMKKRALALVESEERSHPAR